MNDKFDKDQYRKRRAEGIRGQDGTYLRPGQSVIVDDPHAAVRRSIAAKLAGKK